jgi:fructose-specific phosphotransferase system IIC component
LTLTNPVKVIAETLIWCGVFGVIVRFFNIERTVGHGSLHFLFIITIHIKSVNKQNIKHT